MKRVLSGVLGAVMMLGLIGCGGNAKGGTEKTPETKGGNQTAAQTEKKTEPKKETSLVMWTFPFAADEKRAEEQANYDKMIKDFTAENPNIKMSVEIIPWGNRETKMLTAIAAGSGPDIMYLNPDILKQFQAYGVLSPITDYVSPDTLKSYSDSLLDNSVRLQGKLYGIPVLVDLGRPVYNMDMLSKIGMTEDKLPKTWAEFDAMLKALKEKDIYGIYYNYALSAVSNGAYAQFFSEGCDVVKEDGTVDIDNAAGRKVLHRLADWFQKGYTPKDSLSIGDDDSSFISGKVASCFSVKGAGFFVRVGPDLKFNWAAGPILTGDAGQYGISTVGSLGVSKSCKNVQDAVKWIEFFTQVDRNAEWCYFGGYICPKAGAKSPYEDLKGYGYLLKHLDCVRGEPNHAAARTMSSVFTPDLQALVSGKVEFDAGVTKLKTDIEKVVQTVNALKN